MMIQPRLSHLQIAFPLAHGENRDAVHYCTRRGGRVWGKSPGGQVLIGRITGVGPGTD
jgi:hypothetical protein